MNAARRELFEGLGLAAIAILFTGMLLYAGVVAIQKTDYARAALGCAGTRRPVLDGPLHACAIRCVRRSQAGRTRLKRPGPGKKEASACGGSR